MHSKSVYKVPKGKLLKIFLDYDEKNQVINSVKITGDFFSYPLEGIELIEKNLEQIVLDREVLFEKVDSTIKKHDINFIGVDAKSIVDGIMRGVK